MIIRTTWNQLDQTAIFPEEKNTIYLRKTTYAQAFLPFLSSHTQEDIPLSSLHSSLVFICTLNL